jgi:hypothetical protein
MAAIIEDMFRFYLREVTMGDAQIYPPPQQLASPWAPGEANETGFWPALCGTTLFGAHHGIFARSSADGFIRLVGLSPVPGKEACATDLHVLNVRRFVQ